MFDLARDIGEAIKVWHMVAGIAVLFVAIVAIAVTTTVTDARKKGRMR